MFVSVEKVGLGDGVIGWALVHAVGCWLLDGNDGTTGRSTLDFR